MPHKYICSIICLMLSFLLILTVTQPVASAAAERKKISVINFRNESQMNDPALSQLITDTMTEAIITNRAYTIIERPALLVLLKTSGLSEAALFEQSANLAPGQLKGLDYIVTGKIREARVDIAETNGFLQLRINVLLAVRLINTVTGTVVYAEAATGEAKKTFLLDKKDSEPIDTPANRSAAFTEAAKKALTRVIAQVQTLNPQTGIVLKVDETANTILIDLGFEQGVAIGQQYTVFTTGDTLVHPVTQVALGKETKEVGIIKIIHVENQHATGELIKGALKNIQSLQLVKKI